MMSARAAARAPTVKLPKAPKLVPRAILSVVDRARIRSKCMADDRIIKRWAAGGVVRPATAYRIERACADLGIPVVA